MDRGATELRYGWLEPRALQALLDRLRAAGYRLGVCEYLAAQDLVLALVARGESFEEPRRLGRWLRPLLASTVVEQEDFDRHFDRWLALDVGRDAIEPPPSPEPIEQELEALRRRSQLLLRLGVLVPAALAVGALVLWLGPWIAGLVAGLLPSGGVTGPAAERATDLGEGLESLGSGWQLLLAALSGAALFLIGWRAWWERRARRFLERRPTAERPDLERVTLAGTASGAFDAAVVFRLAQDLKRRLRTVSDRLDEAATVNKSVTESGGWLTPVYATVQVSPEYLVLVDRRSFGDQQARLVDELIDGLKHNEVFVDRFYFKGEAPIFTPRGGGGEAFTLRQLAARFPRHRLLIFSDGWGFFDPLTGALRPWLEELLAWQPRALLTPEPEPLWGQRERRLAELLTVQPATVEGLRALLRAIQGAPARGGEGSDAFCPLPEELRADPRRWLDRSAPEPAVVEGTLAAVRRFLGAPGMLWLAACGAFPRLDWELTLFLGKALTTEGGEPLLEPGRLRRLVRLPWLRFGRLPDWLRVRLVAELTHEQELAVRSTLRALLLTASRESEAGIDPGRVPLDYAREHGALLARLSRPLMRVLSRQASDDHPVKDVVFCAS